MQSPFGSNTGYPSQCRNLDLEFLHVGSQHGSTPLPLSDFVARQPSITSEQSAPSHPYSQHHHPYSRSHQQPQFGHATASNNHHLYNQTITRDRLISQPIQPSCNNQFINSHFHVPIPPAPAPLAASQQQLPPAPAPLEASRQQLPPAPAPLAASQHQQFKHHSQGMHISGQTAQPLPSFDQLTREAESAITKAREELSQKGGPKKGTRPKRKRTLQNKSAPTTAEAEINLNNGTTGAPQDDTLPPPLSFDSPQLAASLPLPPPAASLPLPLPAASLPLPPPAAFLPRGLKPAPASRVRLEEDIVAEYRSLPLDELRRLAVEHAENARLCAEDLIELDGLYEEYQCQVYITTIKNKLCIEPVLDHLGLATRIKGSTCYNNFCQYNPEASKIRTDKSKTSQQHAHEMGLLWEQETDQQKWYNTEFLDSLPNPYKEGAKRAEAEALTNKKRKSYVDMKPDRWASKVIIDLKKLSTAYGVEGFLLLASRHKKRTVMTSGGSIMGVRFLDMFPEEMDLQTDFINYVKGQNVIAKVTGSLPPPPKKPRKQRTGKSDLADEKYAQYNKGLKSNNLKALRPLLVGELHKASNARWKVSNGWPGTHTIKSLQRVGVKMQVKKDNDLKVTPNDFCHRLDRLHNGELHRLLVAVGEGWFELHSIDPEVVDVEDEPDIEVEPECLDAGEASRTAQDSRNNNPADKSTKEKSKSAKTRQRPKKANPKPTKSKAGPTGTKPSGVSSKQTRTSKKNHAKKNQNNKPTKSKASKSKNIASDNSKSVEDTPDKSSEEEDYDIGSDNSISLSDSSDGCGANDDEEDVSEEGEDGGGD
ncbi:hypothetical protein PCANC_11763 [Puccinia coronata f. sp. avenae]|uniref:Uncharacterized protein n=1 Tax=Puccinia coronata f. sp. avenae TaxID=200324 RepID=A0A2N5UY46_9BASI|nr:hypothetical protein PCANC_11763 [Puccinia coronata f. sp. avenae]